MHCKNAFIAPIMLHTVRGLIELLTQKQSNNNNLPKRYFTIQALVTTTRDFNRDKLDLGSICRLQSVCVMSGVTTCVPYPSLGILTERNLGPGAFCPARWSPHSVFVRLSILCFEDGIKIRRAHPLPTNPFPPWGEEIAGV